MNVKKIIFTIFLLAVFLSGCVSLTTFQGPETTRPGEFTSGIGFSRSLSNKDLEIVETNLELFGRVGLSDKVDCGVKIAGLFTTLAADVKFQFLKGKHFKGSFDMAFSYFRMESDVFGDKEKSTVFGLYPSLIFGTKHLYFGPKLVYLIGTGDVEDYIDSEEKRLPSKKAFLGFVTGLQFYLGKRLRAIPEITVYYTPDYGVWFHSGIAFAY